MHAILSLIITKEYNNFENIYKLNLKIFILNQIIKHRTMLNTEIIIINEYSYNLPAPESSLR